LEEIARLFDGATANVSGKDVLEEKTFLRKRLLSLDKGRSIMQKKYN
jgi:hypothetical protein